ncbi:hypothetical protein D3C76_1033000 [compost metagenome]
MPTTLQHAIGVEANQIHYDGRRCKREHHQNADLFEIGHPGAFNYRRPPDADHSRTCANRTIDQCQKINSHIAQGAEQTGMPGSSLGCLITFQILTY